MQMPQKITLLSFLFSIIVSAAYSQADPQFPPVPEAQSSVPAETKEAALADTTVFQYIELEPRLYYDGKNEKAYVASEVKRYKDSLKIRETGVVVIKVIVERNGKLTQPLVVESKSNALRNYSLQIIQSMPKWSPGSLNGWDRRSYATLRFEW